MLYWAYQKVKDVEKEQAELERRIERSNDRITEFATKTSQQDIEMAGIHKELAALGVDNNERSLQQRGIDRKLAELEADVKTIRALLETDRDIKIRK